MINHSPSFSAPSSSPQAPSWSPTDAQHHAGMSHAMVDHHFSAEHTNSAAFQPMFNPSFTASFQPNAGAMSGLDAHAGVLAQPAMYAAHGINAFWKPSPSAHLVKLEPGSEMFAPHDFPSYPTSHAMTASMSLPNYATYTPDRRFNFSDAESLSSVASPTSTPGASSRPASAKRGAKRKTMLDASFQSPADADSLDGTADAAKANKKNQKQAGQRRPPPSASHITESGKPFPVIDTSAKHSSLFVPPDTTGLTKREARLVKNRAAAFLSRQRKREQFEEMEIKCKGISMLVWRMWEAIAGPDAGLDRVDSTPLAAVLANEDPAARLVLEEVITKKGASIAPTSDELDGTPGPETQPEAIVRPTADASASTVDKRTNAAAGAELERARSDLAASMQRESQLLAQIETLRASVATAQASMAVNAMPVTDFGAMHVSAAHAGLAAGMGVGSMPFKGEQGAELPLFVPESPLSKFNLGGDASNSAMMLDASHSAGFDLSKTPTLAMFSENALRSRSAQPFDINGKVAATAMGLGLDYRFPCASAPSSPSTASSSSMSSSRSRANSLIFNRRASNGKPPSTFASVLLLAGMSLMGVGPSAQDLAAVEASTVTAAAPSRKQARAGRSSIADAKSAVRAAPSHTPGQPSSHLSDDDLLMEMGLDAASLSDAEDHGVDVNDASNVASSQSAGAVPVSCA